MTTGWAIVNATGQYLTVHPTGYFMWTANPKQALLFVREQDAMALAIADKKLGEIGQQAGAQQISFEEGA